MTERPRAYTPRQRQLLLMAVESLRDLRDPYANTQVVTYNMTVGELFWLACELAFIIDAYLATES